MRVRTNIATGAVLTSGLMVAGLLNAPAALVNVHQATTAGPQLVSGVVVDENGEPVQAADIEVYIEDRRAEGDWMTKIADGHTNPHGKFLIHGNLARKVARTVHHDDTVTLQVNVNDGIDTKHFDLDVLPPAPSKGRPDWSWGPVVDSGLLPETAAPAAQEHAGDALDLKLRMGTENAPAPDGISPEDVGAAGPETDQPAAEDGEGLALMSHGSCDGYYLWKWIKDTATNNTKEKRYVPAMQIGQFNRSEQNFGWRTTNNTSLMIAYTGAGTVSGAPYQGGFSKVTEESASKEADLNFPVPKDGEWLGFAKQRWIYQKQKQVCVEGYTSAKDGVFIESGRYDTKHRRYKPRSWELGSQKAENGKTWGCTDDWHKTVIAGKTSITNGKTARYNGWFSIANVKLDVTQVENDQTWFNIKPVGFEEAAICGKGNAPHKANLIREIRWKYRA